jgi:hypothetical protein
MKIDKSIIFSFVLLVLIASLYRVLPGRPLGFAPQIAMALFSGSIIRRRSLSFAMPLLSMLVSDLLYQALYALNMTTIPGFYDGQWLNYLLFAAVTVIGFAITSTNWVHIFAGSVGGTLFYFLTSNFAVWIGGGLALNNLPYPKTLAGLTECYVAGLPFLSGSFYATVLFSGILFGGYRLVSRAWKTQTATV